ncbi:hypothetical protein F5Y04DRAFT_280557 [Hypomontagnella monticulosa]|nr:hypothetical protein F5Y04DRAFT_280557 [Hypomontagnella monticulosa]
MSAPSEHQTKNNDPQGPPAYIEAVDKTTSPVDATAKIPSNPVIVKYGNCGKSQSKTPEESPTTSTRQRKHWITRIDIKGDFYADLEAALSADDAYAISLLEQKYRRDKLFYGFLFKFFLMFLSFATAGELIRRVTSALNKTA